MSCDTRAKIDVERRPRLIQTQRRCLNQSQTLLPHPQIQPALSHHVFLRRTSMLTPKRGKAGAQKTGETLAGRLQETEDTQWLSTRLYCR